MFEALLGKLNRDCKAEATRNNEDEIKSTSGITVGTSGDLEPKNNTSHTQQLRGLANQRQLNFKEQRMTHWKACNKVASNWSQTREDGNTKNSQK